MMSDNSTKKYHKGTILQVLPELFTGGVERGTVEISRALVEKGFKSVVVSSGGPLVEIIKKQGGKHYTLPLKGKNPISIFLNIKRIKKVIAKEKADLVHARSRAPAWSAYFAAKEADIPFITTFHGFYKFSNFFKKFYNSIMTKGFFVIAVSEFIKDHILQKYSIPADHIDVIHRGADLTTFNPEKISFQRMKQIIHKFNLPDDKIIICLPGRISKWKGQDLLLKAMAKLPINKFHAIFVGDYQKKTNYYFKLLKLTEKLNLTKQVTFTGNLHDIATIYKLSDIIVSASCEPEAFGRIAIEAQAMQKIIIASDIGGSRETIKEGKTGFLFENNNEQDLANKIIKASKLSPEKIALIGKNAREHVEKNFSLEKMTNKTLSLYKKIIKVAQESQGSQ